MNHVEQQVVADLRSGRTDYAFGVSSIPGTSTVEATHHSHSVPIGIVWYSIEDNQTTLRVRWSYVRECYRGCGVRSFLHARLIEEYPKVRRVVTDSGTSDGRKWLLSQGFKEIKGRHFELKVKR